MKKKILILIATIVICITSAIGQITIPSIEIDSSGNGKPYSIGMTYVIYPLDKTIMSTGILSDKAYQNAAMDSFNGLTDSVITKTQAEQIHRQLYIGSVRDNVIISPEALKQFTQPYLNQDIIPLVILNVKYNKIKEYALENNLLIAQGNQLFDEINRNESPYYEKRLFSVNSTKKELYSANITYRIDDQFYLTNTEETILKTEIDFGDGNGLTEIRGNMNANIHYNNLGTKFLTVKLTLSDSTILTSRTVVEIKSLSEITPDESFSVQGYRPFENEYAYGDAYILYGCGNNNKLRKPIIVTDGFDPENERSFNELYEMLNTENFIEKARKEGFDFVILNFLSGADYIQRNAQVLISTIMEVNKRLLLNNSDQQLVVVGPSMGGLISRYALTYMEKMGLNHNTRLYISFDSPHNGANIPLGDQFWLKFFSTYKEDEALQTSMNTLNSIAAQQMLVYHHLSFPYVHPLRNALNADPFFTFPTLPKKVAISSGSGINQTFFNGCDQIIGYNYTTWLGNLAKGDARAVPTNNGGTCKIFDGKITLVGWLYLEVITWEITVSGTNDYDGAPGGSINVNSEIADGDTGGYGDITTEYPNSCFIPVISSLAINTNDLHYNIFNIPNYPYPANNISSFDEIYAPIINLEHVEVNPENVSWMMNVASPNDLILQSLDITINSGFEARNSILVGNHVNPHYPFGDFIVRDKSKVTFLAGDYISLKEGTWFENGSIVDLNIGEFACSPFYLPQNNASPINNDWQFKPTNLTKKSENINNNKSNTYTIFQNYPNPFNERSTIRYSISNESSVEISIYNTSGLKVQVITQNANHPAGEFSLTFESSNLKSGTYICLLKEDGEVTGTLKMIVTK